MHRVPLGAEPPFDFWEYFDAIPTAEFQGHDCSEGIVYCVYDLSCGRYSHVLVNSKAKDVFMVLVLDLKNGVVFGHRVLNLNDKYGIAKA